MRRVWFCQIVVVLLALTACGAQNSADQLTSELQTVKSWTETARMVGDAWMHSQAPDAYTKQTLQTAQDELQTEAETVAQLDGTPTDQRTAVQTHIQKLAQTVGEMTMAVQNDDRTALASDLDQLTRDEQPISEPTQTAEAKP